MQISLRTKLIVRAIAFLVIAYGISIIADSLLRQFRLHPDRHFLRHLNDLIVGIPLVIGLSFLYLGTLLLRQKHNAWLAALVLLVLLFGLDFVQLFKARTFDIDNATLWRHIIIQAVILIGLVLERKAFRVRSDTRSFRQSVRFSVVIIAITLFYGVSGFLLLDDHDFHQNITVAGAFQRTIDQFGLTTDHPNPYTKRARIFVDSLSVVSIATGAYILISFFQPLRARFSDQSAARVHTEELLETYPSDIDDFFKLWPHDKTYYFDTSGRAGLAYHITRGQALVVGDPFGDPKRFAILLESFLELCFVNDWDPVFVHTTAHYEKLYERFDFRLQKLGEEAIVDLEAFQNISNDKYFRQIRNRFTKLGYSVELLQPPFAAETLQELKAISDNWLEKPGREERRLMMGYFTPDYLSRGSVAVAVDTDHRIQGFINLVPTFEPQTANYDMLRCSKDAPGNCNDFLLIGLIEILHQQGVKKLNLGLTPLAGLDDETDEEATLVHNTLRFVYANGDRFYSFSGLNRFKSKYQPAWEDRYVAYRGGISSFLKGMTALTRAMRVK